MNRKERLVNFRVTDEQYHLLCQKAASSIEAPGVAVSLQSESDLAKLARPRLQTKCPICDGPTSSLTGGACLTCRRKMDAAIDAQMKRLADDREFQRELGEALEQLDAMPPQKLRYCECCKEPFHDDYRSVCGKHSCQVWLEGEKYRRWDVETEAAIKLAGRE